MKQNFLQYFSKLQYNWAAVDTFCKVMERMNHTGLCDAKFT